ncbi:MAG: SDR family oxidoreductase [Candidatus Nanoarchaeia archaeon]
MVGTILVTGATGKVGREVIKQLVAAKMSVRAGIYNHARIDKIEVAGYEQADFDFMRPDTMDLALNGVEKVLLITPLRENMVEMTKNFIDAAKKKDVKHIVRISIIGADNPDGALVLRMHKQCEDILLDSKIPCTILRSNWFMQDFIKYAPSIKKPGAFYAPIDLKGSISFIDIRDVAAIAVLALQKSRGGELFNLTGPQTFTHRQVEDNFAFVLGKRVIFHTMSDEDFRQTMIGYGVSEWHVHAMLEMYKEAEKNTFAEIDLTSAKILNRKPETFKTFVKAYVKSFKD